jgi:uncharacterized membrane protein YecN with MAPEG domain
MLDGPPGPARYQIGPTGGLTATWCLGRVIYARAYYADPAKRGPGFGLTFFPTLIMLVAGLWGGVSALI